MRSPTAAVILIAMALLGILGYRQLSADVFLLDGFEIDSLHAIDIAARMALGEMPHSDFPTALGYFAFAPIAFFMSISYPMGTAFVASQIVVAACITLAGVWVGISRLNFPATLALLVSIIVSTMAVTISVDPDVVTFGGHYNRWAWSVAFLVITISFLPSRSERGSLVDGVVLGTGFFCLLLLKVTFVVGLAPFTAFMVVASARRRAVVAAALTVAVLLVGWTLHFGLNFWVSYAENLVWVSSGELRSNPGNDLLVLLFHPLMAACAFVTCATAAFFAYRGNKSNAIGILILGVGCFYIAYQNFGNLPLWIVGQAILLIALFSRFAKGVRMLPALSYITLTLVSLAISIDLLFGMAVSAMRGPAWGSGNEAMPVFEVSLRRIDARDIVALRSRLSRIDETRADRCDDPAILRPVLEIADELADIDGRVFVADVIAPYWLFGAGQRVAGHPPWNYGSLRGLENADYILVPTCPFREAHSTAILTKLEQSGLLAEPIASSAWFELYENVGAGSR